MKIQRSQSFHVSLGKPSIIDKRKNVVVECALLRIKQIYTQLLKSNF